MLGQSMQHSQRVAAGLSVPATEQSALAAAQAVWRFPANDKVTPQRLIEPLRQFAQQQINGGYVLHVVDWCKLHYKNHPSKQDRISDSFKDCNGYDFTAQLAVNADTGSLMAPVQTHLKTANGFYTKHI
jgi:hypothetical protein